MDINIAQRLQEYINAEICDSELYRNLASNAPCAEYSKLLLEFSDDERSHAEMFQSIYRVMTGQSYQPAMCPQMPRGSFREILLDRVLDESRDYRKYGDEYKLASRNRMLGDAFFRAMTDENVHALRLHYMLNDMLMLVN